jgi:uncharacterized membrane protein
MILFELMELKPPFEGGVCQVIESVKQKNVKPLTRKTPESLILIYNSILSAVRLLFLLFIIFVIFIINVIIIVYYYLLLFIIIYYLFLFFVLGTVPSPPCVGLACSSSYPFHH